MSQSEYTSGRSCQSPTSTLLDFQAQARLVRYCYLLNLQETFNLVVTKLPSPTCQFLDMLRLLPSVSSVLLSGYSRSYSPYTAVIKPQEKLTAKRRGYFSPSKKGRKLVTLGTVELFHALYTEEIEIIFWGTFFQPLIRGSFVMVFKEHRRYPIETANYL